MEGSHRTLGVAMIDEAAMREESEKLSQMADIAMSIDIEKIKAIRSDAEFLTTVLDGWVAEMMRTAIASTDAFLEYRAKIDIIVNDMGLDMLLNLGKGVRGDD
jgi:hypothetical protein